MDKPDIAAVQSVLSEISAEPDSIRFTTELMTIFGEILSESSGHDPDASINAEMLVKAVLLSFFSGYRSALAQRDGAMLDQLLK